MQSAITDRRKIQMPQAVRADLEISIRDELLRTFWMRFEPFAGDEEGGLYCGGGR